MALLSTAFFIFPFPWKKRHVLGFGHPACHISTMAAHTTTPCPRPATAPLNSIGICHSIPIAHSFIAFSRLIHRRLRPSNKLIYRTANSKRNARQEAMSSQFVPPLLLSAPLSPPLPPSFEPFFLTFSFAVTLFAFLLLFRHNQSRGFYRPGTQICLLSFSLFLV